MQANHGEGADLQSIKQAIATLFESDQVVEVRVPGKYGAISGYFDDHDKLAKQVKRLSDGGEHSGIYYTLNPCHSALLARRAKNRLHHDVKETTSDNEIARRRWLFIDFDPSRPKGISSTKGEFSQAKHALEAAWDWLSDQGWPDPVTAKSGNGYHLLYRVDEPNDKPTAKLFQDCLAALNQKFATDNVAIDTKVFNAARITKAYGSLAAKGENTLDRPHRFSELFEVTSPVKIVIRSQLEALARTLEEPKPSGGSSRKGSAVAPSTIEEFLGWGAVAFKPGSETGDGGMKWILEECPFNPQHRGSAVSLSSVGVLGFHCFHESCAANRWEQFRKIVEENKGAKFVFAEKRQQTDYSRNASRVDYAGSEGKLQKQERLYCPTCRTYCSENAPLTEDKHNRAGVNKNGRSARRR